MEVARDTTNTQSGKTSQRRVDFNVIAWLSVCPLWGLGLESWLCDLGELCATSSSLKSLICKMEVMLMLVCRWDTRQVST